MALVAPWRDPRASEPGALHRETIMKNHAFLSAALLVMLVATPAPGAGQAHQSSQLQFYPDDAGYLPEVPTLERVVGHEWGERVTSPEEIERYIHALAEASPRVSVHEYARTWEGRRLYYVVVASQTNIDRIESLREANLSLADPRATSSTQAEQIIADNPVITWLAYGVHGNEISSGDAALLTMYHLAAAANDELAAEVLANSVVILDPMQNPDGRNRFVSHYRQSKGVWADSNTASVELREPWPGGRTNHYLFDLNRDWFAQTQPESRGKVAAFMRWRPQVYVDLHEMGGDSTYYFPPQAPPQNPNQTEDIASWIEEVGRNNARWFDRMGFDYFTGEVFDAFYPGYGVSWPMFQGALGMTYEQASSRGLLRERTDETVLEYRHTVQHHFIASLATAETAANNRVAILRDFYDFGVEAIQSGGLEDIREVIITPGNDPRRVDKLVRGFMTQGVEVARATEPFGNVVSDYYGGNPERREFPAGSYRISMAQPAKHLVKVLLAPETPMDEEFLRQQRRRYERRQGDQIYDISGWSLPLLFDLEAYTASEPSTPDMVLSGDLLEAPPGVSGSVHGGPAQVAYLVPWGAQGAVEGLAALHHHDIRVHSAGDSFSIGGRDYPAGSLIIKVHDNGANLHTDLERIAANHNVDFYPTDTSWVDDGINFGSRRVRYLPKPRIALAWDRPTSANSAGWARYLIEVPYHYPVTIVRVSELTTADLDDFNVLILPDAFSFGGGGGYGDSFSERTVERIGEWLQAGGTLITLGSATRWLIAEDVGMLASSLKTKMNAEDEEATMSADGLSTGLPEGVVPEEEDPTPLPGTILRAQLDPEHWLAFGYGDRVNLIAQSRNIYEPVQIDDGINVATYLSGDALKVSGVAWDDELELIAGTPFLMHQPHGRGHVVAFAEDPNFRAYFDGLNLLFLNGVFLGPGY